MSAQQAMRTEMAEFLAEAAKVNADDYLHDRDFLNGIERLQGELNAVYREACRCAAKAELQS